MEETLTVTAETVAIRNEKLLSKQLRRIACGNGIRHIVFSTDGKFIVTVADVVVNETRFDSMIACWNSDSGDLIWTVQHSSWVFSPTFLPDGRRVAVAAGWPGARGGKERQLLILDAASGELYRTIPNTPVAKSIAVTADARYVAVGEQEYYEDHRSSGERGMAVVYNLSTAEPVLKVAPHLNRVSALAFSPDGKTLPTDFHLRNPDPEAKEIWLRSEVRLWDVNTGSAQMDNGQLYATMKHDRFRPGNTNGSI